MVEKCFERSDKNRELPLRSQETEVGCRDRLNELQRPTDYEIGIKAS